MPKPKKPPKFSHRELLLATTFFVRNLTYHLVLSGIVSPVKLREIIEVTASHLDREGVPRASDALGAMFQATQTGKVDAVLEKRKAAKKGKRPSSST